MRARGRPRCGLLGPNTALSRSWAVLGRAWALTVVGAARCGAILGSAVAREGARALLLEAREGVSRAWPKDTYVSDLSTRSGA